MRSKALVCAIVLALAGMAAGATAEGLSPEPEAPAPEISAPVLEPSPVEKSVELTDVSESMGSAPVWTPDVHQAVEWALNVTESVETNNLTDTDIAPQADEASITETPLGMVEVDANEESDLQLKADVPESTDTEGPMDIEVPSSAEDPTDAEVPSDVEDPMDAEVPSETEVSAPDESEPETAPGTQEQEIIQSPNKSSSLSFNGWDYSDTWDGSVGMDSSGIVSVLNRTCINTRPGDSGRTLTWVGLGTELEYLNVTEYDGEGVAWYQVYWDGWTGWVSSRNTRLWWPTYY